MAIAPHINGVVTLTDTGVRFEFKYASAAQSTFRALQDIENAQAMTLWVRQNGRCDWVSFTPNGG